MVSAQRNEQGKIALADVTPGKSTVPKTIPEETEKHLIEKFTERKNIYNKEQRFLIALDG